MRRRADQVGAENPIKNVLPGLIEGYDQNDIFNADETELHYRVLSPSPVVILLVVKRPKDRMTDAILWEPKREYRQ